MMNARLKERIEQAAVNSEHLREIYDLENPTDLYIIERMAYYKFAIPLMLQKGIAALSEDDYNNCLIEMYLELKTLGRIYNPKQLP